MLRESGALQEIGGGGRNAPRGRKVYPAAAPVLYRLNLLIMPTRLFRLDTESST